jgi:Cu(I)/Ag(I) efflux system protein CusF
MNFKYRIFAATTFTVLTTQVAISAENQADTSPVLDPKQHPISPKYESVFTTKMIPLDAELSWTERFNGDETFNTEQMLAQTTTETDGMMSEGSMMSEEPMMSEMKMDARGVVKAVRMSQGKVKIEHGPIEKYGMPGMTMMFKVSDPAQLDGLEAGAEVDFDVDNSSGGFVITNIGKVSE